MIFLFPRWDMLIPWRVSNLPETNMTPPWLVGRHDPFQRRTRPIFRGEPVVSREAMPRSILCCRPACPQKYPLAPIPNCSCSEFGQKRCLREAPYLIGIIHICHTKHPAYSRLVKPSSKNPKHSSWRNAWFCEFLNTGILVANTSKTL